MKRERCTRVVSPKVWISGSLLGAALLLIPARLGGSVPIYAAASAAVADEVSTAEPQQETPATDGGEAGPPADLAGHGTCRAVDGVDGQDGVVNISRRTNRAVAINIGSPGSSRSVSSTQHVQIWQNGIRTCEAYESTAGDGAP